MQNIIDKISSYNLFNYLFPGVVFAVGASAVTGYSLIQENMFLGLFLYYFMGLVISRFGSLALEPILRRLKFLRFADYNKFLAASSIDQKLEVLSEVNNTYRTLCSLFILLPLLMLYEKCEGLHPYLKDWRVAILIVLLLVLFLLSWRKQTQYVASRVRGGG